jgi:hypothetical protein
MVFSFSKSHSNLSSKNKIVAALKYFKKSKEIELFSVDREMEKAIANLNMSIVYLRMKK